LTGISQLPEIQNILPRVAGIADPPHQHPLGYGRCVVVGKNIETTASVTNVVILSSAHPQVG